MKRGGRGPLSDRLRRRPAAGRGLWQLPRGRLILASTSPRRRELLAAQGLRFRAVDPEVDETLSGTRPGALARRLALAKARAVAARYRGAWCLGADTLVAVGKRILGKPAQQAEARAALQALAGRTHRVVTAVALVGPGFERCVSVSTRVSFRRLTAAEIAAYAATKEPLDKAGAYAAQGRGAVLIERICGDWFNVVGLPLGAVRDLLEQAARGRSRRPSARRGSTKHRALGRRAIPDQVA